MHRILISFLLTTTACVGVVVQPDEIGGQTGEIAPRDCEDGDSLFAVDEVTPLGFSIGDALGNHTGGTVDLTWWDGSVSEATWTMERDTTQFEGMATHYRPSDPLCDERVEVPVVLQITTDDGRLDLRMQEWFVAYTIEEGRFDAVSYASNNQGSLDLSSLAGVAWDANSATLYTVMDFDGTGTTGDVELMTHSEGTGDSVQMPIASW